MKKLFVFFVVVFLVAAWVYSRVGKLETLELTPPRRSIRTMSWIERNVLATGIIPSDPWEGQKWVRNYREKMQESSIFFQKHGLTHLVELKLRWSEQELEKSIIAEILKQKKIPREWLNPGMGCNSGREETLVDEFFVRDGGLEGKIPRSVVLAVVKDELLHQEKIPYPTYNRRFGEPCAKTHRDSSMEDLRADLNYKYLAGRNAIARVAQIFNLTSSELVEVGLTVAEAEDILKAMEERRKRK